MARQAPEVAGCAGTPAAWLGGHGVAPATVGRIWRRNDLKPDRTKTFRLSKDKDFERESWDVTGLCLDPPEKPVVLRCDEEAHC